jgi:hypothetical protein
MFTVATVRLQVFYPVVFSLRLESGTEISKAGGLLAYRYVVQLRGCHLSASGQACSAAFLRLMVEIIPL